MDFFESQERARKKSRTLILLFGLAVISITVAVFGVTVFAFSLAQGAQSPEEIFPIATDWRLVLSVIAGVLIVVGFGTLTKFFELRTGGQAVASMLGGRRIVGNASNLMDRQVSNVVEEMALASGMPVPPVFILDHEESINAFAAGNNVDDAVIGISRGCAENLSRQELQGVVAHEFSHILNGDMRTNLRMIAVLNGILLLSIIGGQLLNFLSRSAVYSSGRSRNNDQKGQGGLVLILYVIAIGLYLIGSIGLFFGRWIKSSLSQQREFLADASAVQFTRSPDGIGDALKMIGGMSAGSKIKSPNAEQISHMFFGAATANFVFATHPPLMNRIHAIDQTFDGDYQKFMTERRRRLRSAQTNKQSTSTTSEKKRNKLQDLFPGSDKFGLFDRMKMPVDPVVLLSAIGTPTEQDVEYSAFLVDQIPEDLLSAARDLFSARCLVFAFLLSEKESTRTQQCHEIQHNEARGSLEITIKLKALVDALPKHLRLGLFEILQGTLSAMSPRQYPPFRKTINALVIADGVIDLFEFFLYHHLIVHLDRCFDLASTGRIRYSNIDGLTQEIGQVISILARVGDGSTDAQQAAFTKAMGTLFAPAQIPDLFVSQWDHTAVAKALQNLAEATPAIKKKVLSAAAVAISHSGEMTVEEVELFRAMSESIDCPVPPLVAKTSKG